MNEILDIVLLQDIMGLPKETLQEIATDINIPTNNVSRRDLAVAIWAEVSNDQQQKYKSFDTVKPRLLSGKTSVTWYKLDNDNLKGAKDNIIANTGFNPFEETRIPQASDLTNTPVLIGGALGDTDSEYYLRFMYKSGVTQHFNGTEFNILPNSAVKTIYINEEHNCIEVRADAKNSGKFARSFATLIKQQVSLSQEDVLAPYGHDIEKIVDALEGEFIDATAKPELLLESLNEEQAEALISILSTVDEYFQDEDIDQLAKNMQSAKDVFGDQLVSIPFTALVLSGLEKIGMGVSIGSDLRQSSLYKLFKPHIQNQGGFIRFTVNEDGLNNDYTVRVGLNSKSIYFISQASEAAIKYVRERIIY